MNIEKLSPDKLRVTLESAELDRYDLDYISISNESPGTKRMLKDILLEAFSSMGFSTKGSRLLIEVLPGKDEGCVLYLTKVEIQEGKNAVHMPTLRQAQAASNGFQLVCRALEDVIGAVARFSEYPDVPLRRSALYRMDKSYYLIFSPVRFGLDNARMNALIAELSEYGNVEASTPLQEAVLEEHGSVIQQGHAVEQFIRYFQ